ncbi:transcriptional regulator [Rhodomicrobium udaipurense JA643]|uniref:hypothetical protein n=1 Tax=Rhodomicrobium udaipurense TaxID=1202716 RepID=UPI00045B86BE|nr:hypothetical protein [Rhodomicrobium udaipurense]KAI94998.1 transcriptional regulator [Rhodomicrobium udaipurense JA643]
MSTYRYTECGLDNVIIQGVEFVTDDNGEEVVSIPNVNGLHKAIAEGILLRQAGMSGKELRFIPRRILPGGVCLVLVIPRS